MTDKQPETPDELLTERDLQEFIEGTLVLAYMEGQANSNASATKLAKEIIAKCHQSEAARIKEIKSKTYCTYCGTEFAIDDNAGKKVTEHIKTCTKHPLYQALAKIEELKQALVDDATDLWTITNAIKKEIDMRSWILDGRGSYAWDDDKYRDETRLVFEAVLNLIKNVQHPAQLRFHGIVAKVLSNLPTEQELKADITNLEWKLKTTETMARESERKEIYAEISKDLNEAVILHNEIKPDGNVMVKGGFIAELQKKYVAKLRSLVIPKEV